MIGTTEGQCPDEESHQLYDVHFFALVRVKRSGASAQSQAQAIERAREATNLQQLFGRLDNLLPLDLDVAFAEEVEGFLVDESGDETLERGQYYCRHRRPAASGTGDCGCRDHRHA